MALPIEEPRDLGFGSVVGGANEKRLLNRDGTFNPRRKGLSFLASLNTYHFFLSMSWGRFLGVLALGYLGANTLFALMYMACGPNALSGAPPQTLGGVFGRAFFFSVESFATIGYGDIVPVGLASHVVVTGESLVGLLGFALGTGLFFARFSRPTAAVQFSNRAVIAPYRAVTAFMFRVANARSNQLTGLEAIVLFSRIEGSSRKYDQLSLERTRVVFFPLSWTIVHPIDEKSPMFGMTHADFVAKDAEFMIMITGTDETFSQSVQARSSYKPQELVVGHRFVNIYNPIDDDGVVSIDIRKLSETEPAEASDDWSQTTTWHHTGHFAQFSPPPRSGTKRG